MLVDYFELDTMRPIVENDTIYYSTFQLQIALSTEGSSSVLSLDVSVVLCLQAIFKLEMKYLAFLYLRAVQYLVSKMWGCCGGF